MIIMLHLFFFFLTIASIASIANKKNIANIAEKRITMAKSITKRNITSKLTDNLHGTFCVEIDDCKVTISASNYDADSLWDEIESRALLGTSALGWLTSKPNENCVVTTTNKITL